MVSLLAAVTVRITTYVMVPVTPPGMVAIRDALRKEINDSQQKSS